MTKPMRSWSIAMALAAALMMPARAADEGDGLTLRIAPHQAFEPATVQMTVLLDIDSDAERLIIEADSGAFYRRSDTELEGRKAPRLHVIRWRDLPAGEYMVTATVMLAGGVRKAVKDRMSVLP